MTLPLLNNVFLSSSIILLCWWSSATASVGVVSGFVLRASLTQTRPPAPSRHDLDANSGAGRLSIISVRGRGGGKANQQQQQQQQHDRNWFSLRLLPRKNGKENTGNEEKSTALSSSSTVAIVATATSTTVPTLTSSQRRKEVVMRLIRSALVAVGCTSTWGLASSTTSLTSIQASALTGIMGSILAAATNNSNPALAAAMFCGSFAGMSSHIATFLSSALMGSMTAAVYYAWDSRKIGVGVGGRLGTMALISNVLLGTIGGLAGNNNCNLKGVLADTVERLGGPQTVGTLAVLALVAQRLGSCHTAAVGRVSTNKIKTAVKTLMMGILLSTCLFGNNVAWGSLALTFVAVYTSSIVIQETPGVVLPVAVLGMMAGTVFPPSIATPIYLGGLIGMTKKPDFKNSEAAQASLIASVALCGGFWTGLGGRLSTKAFVGVLFSLF